MSALLRWLQGALRAGRDADHAAGGGAGDVGPNHKHRNGLARGGVRCERHGPHEGRNRASQVAFHFWDVSTVTSTESMFRGASTFNGNLFTWNTANITSTAYMFCGTKTHTQPLHTTPGLSERWV